MQTTKYAVTDLKKKKQLIDRCQELADSQTPKEMVKRGSDPNMREKLKKLL